MRRRSGRSTGGARAGGGGGNPPPTRNCRLRREWTSLRDTPVSKTSTRLTLAPPSSKAQPLPLQIPPLPLPLLPTSTRACLPELLPGPSLSGHAGWTDSRLYPFFPGPFLAPPSLTRHAHCIRRPLPPCPSPAPPRPSRGLRPSPKPLSLLGNPSPGVVGWGGVGGAGGVDGSVSPSGVPWTLNSLVGVSCESKGREG